MKLNKPQLLTWIKDDIYPYAIYKCKCGGIKRARRMDVKNNFTRSCGCISKEKPLTERFWARVKKTETCWEWIGHVSMFGYGVFQHTNRTKEAAHRIAYKLIKGDIPERFVIDHLCDNRKCVNPSHLKAVTQRENVLRSNAPSAINSRKTKCPKGHPLSGENLYIQKTNGARHCLLCKNVANKINNAKRYATNN